MRKIWKEEMLDYRSRLIKVLAEFGGSLLLLTLLGRIFSVNMSELYNSVDILPSALLNIVGFWRNKLLSDAQKIWLTVLLIENIFMLFYAALLPVRFLGEENENGTMAFLCNGPFGRKEIFWGKYIAELTVYSVLTVSLMTISAVVLTPGADSGMRTFGVIAVIYGILYIAGLFLMSVTTFFCTVKKATTCSGDTVVLWGWINVAFGYAYTAVLLIKDILEAGGRIVMLPDTARGLLKGMEKISVVQLCNPYDVYQSFPWRCASGMALAAVILLIVSEKLYRKKQFGETR